MLNTIRISAVALAVAVLAACGGGSNGNDGRADKAGDRTGVVSGVEVEGAWVRASIPGKDMTAAYMTLRNTGGADDELLGVSVPAYVADRAEVHETVPAADGDTGGPGADKGGDDHSTDDHTTGTTKGHDDDHTTGTTGGSGPVMTMREVERIHLRRGKAVNLEPGGYHVMILGVKKPLEVGDEVGLQLRFRHAGTITVTAEVRKG